MRIQHNIMAMNSYRNYSANNKALSKNLEKLSSGYKINRAGDDAAGLAISEKMRAQITGLETAQSNAQSGINLVQTAEGALTEVHDMLNRMVELADQSANGTYDKSTDRANLQKEFNALTSEIDRISQASNFNGQKLLDGTLGGYEGSLAGTNKSFTSIEISGGNLAANDTFAITDTADSKWAASTTATGVTFKTYKEDGTAVADTDVKASGNYVVKAFVNEATVSDADKTKWQGFEAKVKYNLDAANGGAAATATAETYTVSKASAGLTLQIGDTNDSFNKLTVSVGKMDAATLGVGSLDITDQTSAGAAVDTIRTAIDTVSATRGNLGATQNRLEHTINNLSVMTENVQDAEANIRDVDVAKEMMEYTKNNILVQSAQAMLAQANQVPQGVLQLLQ